MALDASVDQIGFVSQNELRLASSQMSSLLGPQAFLLLSLL
jgi:hypothetical protein